MSTALRWVHEYINFFGGDPKQIVVMGQGSGAQAATYLTTTQRSSREMVSGVVAMSGSPYTPNAVDETPMQTAKDIISINNCKRENETEIVKCMRAVSQIYCKNVEISSLKILLNSIAKFCRYNS